MRSSCRRSASSTRGIRACQLHRGRRLDGVGGRGTLIGPIIGAILVNVGKSYFTGAFPDLWLFALGGLFIFVTLFLPKGIVGTVQAYLAKRKDYAREADKDAAKHDVKPQSAPVAAE